MYNIGLMVNKFWNLNTAFRKCAFVWLEWHGGYIIILVAIFCLEVHNLLGNLLVDLGGANGFLIY